MKEPLRAAFRCYAKKIKIAIFFVGITEFYRRQIRYLATSLLSCRVLIPSPMDLDPDPTSHQKVFKTYPYNPYSGWNPVELKIHTTEGHLCLNKCMLTITKGKALFASKFKWKIGDMYRWFSCRYRIGLNCSFTRRNK